MHNAPAIPRLGFDYIFPNPRYAMKEGLLAYGGDLNPDRVLMAYRQGIFPWYNEGDPILWWSPDPRLLLYPNDFKIHRSLRKKLRQKRFTVKLDRNFETVMRHCAHVPRHGQEGSWILPEVIECYCALHSRGFAHSVEIYDEMDELVGGLYGISTGSAFFGESMFSLETDASKIALAYLVELAKRWNFAFIDCQIPSEHLIRLGAVRVERDRFLDELSQTQQDLGIPGSWQAHEPILQEIRW
ncbi:leucyl/phenylalanyl-tRNA--protein transferase [Hydrogenimonas cancrithermarum]|uniref:Leucyl/phenylalanyl-tRNA--protein transferase n=1 Tax=Hydrogenimonas cancrithermarum TaxID=2993563 RepID=A0ABN6WU30_9BACT|nr:leucyl/phenylalanyl-tRNA--protein transferase [Hydrogenimonas cancrithermarum]BDY12591.1 leucyl/phenylalanyl-tRNA--protein transferase [Hydrogenimonas cancrithermarum]